MEKGEIKSAEEILYSETTKAMQKRYPLEKLRSTSWNVSLDAIEEAVKQAVEVALEEVSCCKHCQGNGWYIDHADDCQCSLSEASSTCPIQRPCEYCKSTGKDESILNCKQEILDKLKIK